MKIAQLLHNPTAGDEEHSKKELISVIEKNGFECRYASTKSNVWKDIDTEIDFLIAAGGDGTIRKITKQLLDRKLLEKTWPIALLPLGTANNIAKTLGVSDETEKTIKSWHKEKIKKYDVGRIYNIKEAEFFLEAFGFGIFPYLMQEMINKDKESIEVPEERMQASLELLHELILSYKPRYCKLKVDGTDHSGKYLLAEIMNTQSIGPNLLLSPEADPGDGELNIVLVPEAHKDQFASYILNKINGKEEIFEFDTLKAKSIKISWDGTHVHADDQILKIEKTAEFEIEILPGLLEFLIP